MRIKRGNIGERAKNVRLYSALWAEKGGNIAERAMSGAHFATVCKNYVGGGMSAVLWAATSKQSREAWWGLTPQSPFGSWASPRRYVLKIHFFIESGLKMIQFKIQFKTKSGIFIQKNIHSIESKIFKKNIHSEKKRKIIQYSKIRPKYGFGALLRPLYR